MSTGKGVIEGWRTAARESPARVRDRFDRGLARAGRERAEALFAVPPEALPAVPALPSPGPGEEPPPLFGVPFLLQDLFDVEGLPTRCGARLDEVLDQPAESSSLLYRELAQAGAWLAGKLVPSEFGLDVRGGEGFPGTGAHRLGPDFVAGGGAGACAAAVALGLAPLAFGLDTLGGVRNPAAFNGIFAFRMGQNRLAREGVFPIAPSLDAVGWMTAGPGEMAAAIRALYGLEREESDEEYRGFFLEDLAGPLDGGLKERAMALVRELGLDEDAAVRSSLLGPLKGAARALTVKAGRELYSVHRYWIEEYGERYGPAAARVVRKGSEYDVAAADGAAQVRESLTAALGDFFDSYDYLVLPASRRPSPRVAEWNARTEAELFALAAPAGLAGLPALLLPVRCDDGRSGGLQVIFNPRDKQIALSVLALLEDFYAQS
jgi:Asp-tRNA(Asn)/Glu-tRNA(Gln) amidotransferase A subunit family amidase